MGPLFIEGAQSLRQAPMVTCLSPGVLRTSEYFALDLDSPQRTLKLFFFLLFSKRICCQQYFRYFFPKVLAYFVYAPIYFSPLALVIYYFLFRLANLPVTNENKNIKRTTIVQLGRGQPNNSFAVILLLLLSVVFYGFRLNGNWGVHSMFPRIHVLQPNRDRYQLHTHIQGKKK